MKLRLIWLFSLGDLDMESSSKIYIYCQYFLKILEKSKNFWKPFCITVEPCSIKEVECLLAKERISKTFWLNREIFFVLKIKKLRFFSKLWNLHDLKKLIKFVTLKIPRWILMEIWILLKIVLNRVNAQIIGYVCIIGLFQYLS